MASLVSICPTNITARNAISYAANGMVVFPGASTVGAYFCIRKNQLPEVAETIYSVCKRAGISLLLAQSSVSSSELRNAVASQFGHLDLVLELTAYPEGMDVISIYPSVVPKQDKLFYQLSSMLLRAFQHDSVASDEVRIYPEHLSNEENNIPKYLSHTYNIPSFRLAMDINRSDRLADVRKRNGQALKKVSSETKKLLPAKAM